MHAEHLLEVIQQENLISAAEEKGKYLMEALQQTKGVKVVR
jgi:4-aminobutyrate aminotransferase-like enzyme